jgi:citrate lyase beta subunit
VEGLGEHAWVLSGLVLPKFDDVNGPGYLEAVASASEGTPRPLLAMPVIESPEVIHHETRQATLLGIQLLLNKYRERVLAVRIGATDLCAAFGIRRDRDLTIYDVRLVADVITDVMNVLGRADGTGFPVVGPVWEYFPDHERMLKPQLRQGPFDVADAPTVRRQLISLDLDGLIRETLLDKANGLTGKTVIHPSHVPAVHALSVVTHEEYCDATDIVDADLAGGGVKASGYRNKMNEARPHRAWAERTLRRADAFGVAAEDVSVVDVLIASVTA